MNSQALERTLEAQTKSLEASTVALWVCIALAIVSVVFALARYGAAVQAQKAAQTKGKGKKQAQVVGMKKASKKELIVCGIVAAVFFVLALIILAISH